jgi:hypothetical protein
MTRLTALTPAEKKFIDDAMVEAERAKGKKLNRPERHIVLSRARAQIYAARYVAKKKTEPAEALKEAEFTWSKQRPFRR